MIIINQKSSHWYSIGEHGEVTPCFEVPRADGKGMRAVHLGDARKLGLVPSVTTILRVLAKPELQNWLIGQAIGAALTLPRKEGEELDAFAQRVVEDMDAESDRAKGLGSRVHDAIAQTLNGATAVFDPEIEPFMAPLRQWIKENVESIEAVEKILGGKVGTWGYAGTMDALLTLKGIGPAVVDFKTQRVKKNKAGLKTPAYYPEWPLQLAAYRRFVRMGQPCAIVNVVIDTDEPGPPFVKPWDNPEQYGRLWDCVVTLWRYVNKMDQP